MTTTFPLGPYAHSIQRSKGKDGVEWVSPPQSYWQHINNVYLRARANAETVATYMPPEARQFFINIVSIAAWYHDIGKLLPANKVALSSDNPPKHLPRWHSPVGEILLLKFGKRVESRWAALIISCHHRGLYNCTPRFELITEGLDWVTSPKERNKSNLHSEQQPTGAEIATCRAEHDSIMGAIPVSGSINISDVEGVKPTMPEQKAFLTKTLRPILLRMAMSCLAEADYGDTSDHYARFRVKSPLSAKLLPKERLARLKEVLNKTLEKNNTAPIQSMQEAGDVVDAILLEQKGSIKLKSTELRKHRHLLRGIGGVFAEQYYLPAGISMCRYPVGGAKTLSVQRCFLQTAADMEVPPSRIFYIAPYTSIIDQVFRVYREHLVLPSDGPLDKQHLERTECSVVTRHDYRADYEKMFMKKYAASWDAPFVITTAVQFYETFASNRPSKLRKAHKVAGALIFIDEFHSVLKNELAPLGLKWLCELATRFGCRIMLASGSPVKYWEIEELNGTVDGIVVQDMLSQFPRLDTAFAQNEKHRVAPVPFGSLPAHLQRWKKQTVVSLPELINAIASVKTPKGIKGPAMVIMNTVRGAAWVARALSRTKGWCAWNAYDGRSNIVYHISTAMTGEDRSYVLDQVTEAINAGRTNFVLVATSCVEAGVDISFRTTFRQYASTTSMEQAGGRTNRSFEYQKNARLYCFQLDEESRKVIPDNPHIKHQQEAFDEVMERQLDAREKKIKRPALADECSPAKAKEMQSASQSALDTKDRRSGDEFLWQFKKVQEGFKVIWADCITVVADAKTVALLDNQDTTGMSFNEYQSKLVQIAAKYDGKIPVAKMISLDQRDIEEEEGGLDTEIDVRDNQLWKFTDPNFYGKFLGFMEGLLPLIENGFKMSFEDEMGKQKEPE